ncbi:MAG: hypothetical protein AAB614_02145, partial [Patescibacteria group bacterium]
ISLTSLAKALWLLAISLCYLLNFDLLTYHQQKINIIVEYPFICCYFDVTPKFQTNQYEEFFCGGEFSENPSPNPRPHSSPNPTAGVFF